MAAPNIVNVTSIIGKTSLLAVTTTESALVTNSAASNKVLKINSIIISNIDGTNAADITVVIKRATINYPLASTITVAPDSSLVVVSKENTVYLEEGDGIHCTGSANGDLVAICSYEDIS